MKYNELATRLLIAVLAIPIIFAAIYFGKIYFIVLVDLIIVMALWELYKLVELKGFSPSKILGILSVLVISWELYLNNGNGLRLVLLIILLVTLVFELFKGRENPLVNSAVTLFGIFYISLFSCFILIREFPVHNNLKYQTGGFIVIMIFSTIWICDTGAYLFGAKFGKHSLFKRVSPKKTWEGAVAGLITGILAAVILGHIFVPRFVLLDNIIIGVIVGTIGQIGDLVESLYKRDYGVKDSSNILPGHGGFLDRFDSPLFVGPAVYLYLILSGFSG